MVMVLSMTSMATPGDGGNTPAATTPTNNLVVDGSISVSGLETGDTVNFYKILEFSQDAGSTGGWVATSAFAYDATNNPNGLTTADIQKMLGLDSTGKPAADVATNPGNYGISEALAARIGDLAEATTAKYSNVAASGGTAAQASPENGLYVAIVTPGQAGTVYNPVFVGADYDQENDPDTSSIWTVDMDDSYSPESMAKKSHITVEKSASTTEAAYEDGEAESVATGDPVNFTIETTIPEFADNYTSARFFVSDLLSEGLELDFTTVKVYEGWESDSTMSTSELSKSYPIMENGAPATKEDAYAVTKEDTPADRNFKVNFVSAYLLSLNAAKKITIKYTATVTSDAPYSVNVLDNTVTVNYSNTPTDGTGNGTLKDETKHYTFDIDANLLGGGSTPWETTEAVKVGVDKDGNEIIETTTLHGETQQAVGALEGATFKLYVADSEGSTTIKDDTGADLKVSQYTNSILTSSKTIVSDETGRLTIQGEENPGIRGLDIGTYYLVEETAPAGYIKAQNAVKIEIIAPKPTSPATSNDYWELVTKEDETDPTITWKVWELKKYEVEINDVKTASYTFTNEANGSTLESNNDEASKGDNVTGAHGLISDDNDDALATAGKIINKQGVELPSTGGIGTTMFYIIGAILVLGAGILLVTRRRMNAN